MRLWGCSSLQGFARREFLSVLAWELQVGVRPGLQRAESKSNWNVFMCCQHTTPFTFIIPYFSGGHPPLVFSSQSLFTEWALAWMTPENNSYSWLQEEIKEILSFRITPKGHSQSTEASQSLVCGLEGASSNYLLCWTRCSYHITFLCIKLICVDISGILWSVYWDSWFFAQSRHGYLKKIFLSTKHCRPPHHPSFAVPPAWLNGKWVHCLPPAALPSLSPSHHWQQSSVLMESQVGDEHFAIQPCHTAWDLAGRTGQSCLLRKPKWGTPGTTSCSWRQLPLLSGF